MAPTWVEAVIAPVNVRVKNRLSTRNSGSAVTAEDSALSEKINQITLQQAAEKAWRLKQNWHQFVFSCLWAVLWAPAPQHRRWHTPRTAGTRSPSRRCQRSTATLRTPLSSVDF